MSEQIHISSEGTHILVKSKGEPSVDEMLGTISELDKLSQQHQIFNVLVDSRERIGQPSVADIHSVGKLFSEKFRRDMRFAVLVTYLDEDHVLFEDTVVNRGVTLNFFLDEKSAVDWLLN